MDNRSRVTDTLFTDLRRSAFITKNLPDILVDKKAAELSEKLPANYMDVSGDSEYAMVITAASLKNTDMYVQTFLKFNRDGIVVNLGSGLSTTFFRNDNGNNTWYEVDSEEIVGLRKTVFGENERDIPLPYSMFSEEWMDTVKQERPVLFIATEILYYYTYDRVIDYLKKLATVPNSEIIFDAVSKNGIDHMKKYSRNFATGDRNTFFYVHDPVKLVKDLGGNARIITVRDSFALINTRKGLSLETKANMFWANYRHMLKTCYIKLS